jgi:hypothetical protein
MDGLTVDEVRCNDTRACVLYLLLYYLGLDPLAHNSDTSLLGERRHVMSKLVEVLDSYHTKLDEHTVAIKEMQARLDVLDARITAMDDENKGWLSDLNDWLSGKTAT